MPFAATELTQVMGLGHYVGEVREGPAGQLYEWVEGVDGLGNPIGLWKGLRRAASGALQRALPMASRLIPGAGALLPAATGLLRSGGGPGIVGSVLRKLPGVGRITNLTRDFCQALPQLQSSTQQIPEAQRPLQMGTQACDALRRVGLAGTGEEVMAGPDGQLYEVVEGIGEDGVVRRALRPVWLSIPATIDLSAPIDHSPAGRKGFWTGPALPRLSGIQDAALRAL